MSSAVRKGIPENEIGPWPRFPLGWSYHRFAISFQHIQVVVNTMINNWCILIFCFYSPNLGWNSNHVNKWVITMAKKLKYCKTREQEIVASQGGNKIVKYFVVVDLDKREKFHRKHCFLVRDHWQQYYSTMCFSTMDLVHCLKMCIVKRK